jgi:arylsulfatase
MKEASSRGSRPDRRDIIKGAMGVAGGALVANSPLILAQGQAPTRQAAPAPPAIRRRGQPNILFVFSDQERYRSKWPAGLSLPAHEWLQKKGVTFHAHYCPATMCTSSRSVLLTGLTTPNNGMFENCDTPYVGSMSTKVPTIGHMLRKAGYYTAYKGKWHLSPDFDKNTDSLLTKEMEKYGFADYAGIGDIIGHTLGGYQFDHLVSGSAVTWLRRNGRPLQDDSKPWALFVSLVNPHDIMYFNTDMPGQKVQDTGYLMMHAAQAPDHPLYKATWDESLPQSLFEPLDAPGRPKAHAEFIKMWGHVLGTIPPERDRWRRFNDYYINCTRAVDAELMRIFGELEALGMADNTIVVFTSDHGEAAGAHGLRGKGPFAYQETMHLPMFIVHPDVKGGQDCRALTGHIDFVPTLLPMVGASKDQASVFAGRDLPGQDFGSVFTNPGSARANDIRDGVLFTYSGLATNDSEVFRINAEAKMAGRKPIVQLIKEGYRPDMKKRGSVRTVFDGQYKLSRYFSPLERNSPRNVDELFKWNDVELFDLKSDPTEINNLAINQASNSETLAAMNSKLEAIIKAEIGVDDGREMPNIPTIDWTIDRPDL